MARRPVADTRWLLFGTSGRASRRTYLLTFAFWLFVTAIPAAMATRVADGSPAQAIVGLGLVATFVVACISLMVVVVKRLHDIGLPGPVALAMLVPPITFVGLAALALLPSKAGPNRFGTMPDRPGYRAGDGPVCR